MPEFHSKVVGSSTAYRRLNCPGSQALEEMMPDQESIYAAEGTGLHKIAEMMVDKGLSDASVFLGEHVNDAIPAMTQEQVDAVQWCIEIVEGLMGSEDEIALEQYLEFPGIPGAGGTGDLIIFAQDGSYHICDYKFGRGVAVSARNMKGRTQLLFIAVCARALYGAAHSYHLHILQPRIADGHSQITVTDRDLDSFERQLVQAVENFGPVYNVGDWCKFCKAEGACPAKLELAEKAQAMRNVDETTLPAALAMVDEIEEWVAAVRALAHSRLELGGAIYGWKLVEKRATRKWVVDEPKIIGKCRRAGLKVYQFAPRKLISVAQAEKLGVSVEGISEAKSTGTTLARSDDPRPAVSREVRDLADLADLLPESKQKESQDG